MAFLQNKFRCPRMVGHPVAEAVLLDSGPGRVAIQLLASTGGGDAAAERRSAGGAGGASESLTSGREPDGAQALAGERLTALRAAALDGVALAALGGVGVRRIDVGSTVGDVRGMRARIADLEAELGATNKREAEQKRLALEERSSLELACSQSAGREAGLSSLQGSRERAGAQSARREEGLEVLRATLAELWREVAAVAADIREEVCAIQNGGQSGRARLQELQDALAKCQTGQASDAAHQAMSARVEALSVRAGGLQGERDLAVRAQANLRAQDHTRGSVGGRGPRRGPTALSGHPR
ncbi:hypothetical protein T484DRAFT_1767759 [Baffinella frigidus]|nr:hypothetical protein T484DRAFT_1767759 [Cryptophyta sp. CCMP2293]